MRLAVAFAVLLLAGCMTGPADPSATSPTQSGSTTGSGTAPPTTTTAPPTGSGTSSVPLSATAQGIVDANTAFAVLLLREAMADAPGTNVFTSPFSVYSALAMAQQGAEGETRQAMQDVLQAPDDERLGEEYRQLLARVLAPRQGVDLAVGNALWMDAAFAPEVRADYLDALGRDFGAEVATLDFRSPEAVEAVNGWAKQATRGHIPRVLDSISRDEVMLLANAVYFRGDWAAPFNATCTHAQPFTRSDGSVVEAQMMCGANRANLTHHIGPDASVGRLPYAGGSMAFYVVLPPEGTSLADFLQGLDGARLDALFGQATQRGADILLPRLDVKTHLDLKPPLERLGMGVAFTDRADFSGIAPGLLLTRVLHDAVLKVDEKGSTAAAVTVVGVGLTSLPPQVVADRPFLAAIRDEGTGALLFLGAIEDPTAQ